MTRKGSRVIGSIVGLAMAATTWSAEAALILPGWFDQNVFDFSFTDTGVGGGDIDRVTAIGHPSDLGGLEPGLEWVAWVDLPNIYMTSWEGYE